jgi:hypothetical protein
MRVTFRPEARLEALQARSWFDERSPGLGFDFARAPDAALATAIRRPQAFRQIEHGCRRIVLRRFPYAPIYRLSGEEFLVVAVFHHRRDPLDWQGRLSPGQR